MDLNTEPLKDYFIKSMTRFHVEPFEIPTTYQVIEPFQVLFRTFCIERVLLNINIYLCRLNFAKDLHVCKLSSVVQVKPALTLAIWRSAVLLVYSDSSSVSNLPGILMPGFLSSEVLPRSSLVYLGRWASSTSSQAKHTYYVHTPSPSRLLASARGKPVLLWHPAVSDCHIVWQMSLVWAHCSI